LKTKILEAQWKLEEITKFQERNRNHKMNATFYGEFQDYKFQAP
jgi:hypothetical protein